MAANDTTREHEITPLLYEINARHWVARLGTPLPRIPDAELDRLAALGITHLWLMGVWPTGPRSRTEALDDPSLREAYGLALPGWTEGDVLGSPFAVADFHVADFLGGDAGLAILRGRLAARGIRLVLDFVPNHTGLDHPWLRAHPERFVGGATPEHGKDPHFPGWTDTAQLDYRAAATRAAMTDVLRSIAAMCDGVRCDMAMLVLSDVFERTWAHVPLAPALARATGEFWSDAIGAVRGAHPDFMFLAEAYWGLEDRLVELGFTYAYDKLLYDLVVHDHAWDVQPHLLGLGERVAGRAHFLENHDEPRVAGALELALHHAALCLILGLPGMRFLHDGQLTGARRFARVQLARCVDELVDPAIHVMSTRVLRAFAASSVGRGTASLLAPRRAWDDNPTAQCFTVVQWQRPGEDGFDLVVVNLASHRAQCRVVPTIAGLAGGAWQLADRLGAEHWTRAGDELASTGLFLDLPARGAQLFAFSRG